MSRLGKNRRAAVIGAGPVGCASAAVLARHGFEVRMVDIEAAAVEPIRERGEVRLSGALQGSAPIAHASTDAGEVLPGAEIVVNAVPGNACEAVAAAAAPHLEDGVVLLLQPGQTLSSVAFRKTARAHGFRGELTLAETVSTLYTSRLIEPGHVDVFALKRAVPFAALPARRTARVAEMLQPIYQPLTPVSSVLETSLLNVNATLHPTVVLANVRITDEGSGYLFYKEGVSPAVARMAEVVDAERVAIATALGVDCGTLLDWYRMAYHIEERDLYHTLAAVKSYASIVGPRSLDTRLLLEDVPTGLVPFLSLAKLAGVECPLMAAQVEMCNALYGVDFYQTGRTLEKLGLGDLDREGLWALVNG